MKAHCLVYECVRHYVYTHRVSHTSLRRNHRVNLDVGDASRHEATRAYNEHLASSLPPSSSFFLSFFVRHRSLALGKHHILVQRFYLRENSKGDGQLCHRRCSLTGRRRDATTRRLKSPLRHSEFLLCIPPLSPRSSRTARRLCLAFFSLTASCFSRFH